VEPSKSKYLAAFNLLDSPGGSALQSYDPTLNQVSNSMHSCFPASTFDTLDLNMEAFCDIVCKLKADFPLSSLCFVLEETYFLEYATPTSPPSPGISLRQTVQPSESWHYGWVREADRLPIQHWLDQGETIHLMPLRFGARFRGRTLVFKTL
jgi:hypothetical protein